VLLDHGACDSRGGDSVQSLESQVAELEDEVERLSASLETQKLAASEVQMLGNKKVEEISREVTRKVNERGLWPCYTTHVSRPQKLNTSRHGSSNTAITKKSNANLGS
jgi:predicted RNase H-like nuclease (RuvC/YqgF family)